MTAVDGSDAVANTTCWQVSWMLFPVISRCPADATSAGQYGQLSPTVQWPTETSTLLCTHTFILTILTHRHTERPYMTIVYALWVPCAFLSFPLSRRVKGSPVMLYNSNIIIIQLCIFLQTPFYLHINILSRYSLRSIDQQATKWWKYVWVWFYFLSLGWNNYDETE